MEEQGRTAREQPERERAPEERIGGGPEAPEGDTEPSNWPGETRERGMTPPEPQPAAGDGVIG